MSFKRERSVSPVPPQEIYRSKRIEEGKSVFIAAFSHSLSVKALQRLPEFRTATHRIAAWRKRSRQMSLMPATKILYDTGHDDDGEARAGARLRHVLDEMNVEGNVVVARWYGGQNIGPIRFTHIENTAKEAIWNFKAAETESKQEQTAKKQKVEEQTTKKQEVQEETAKKELEQNLRERDLNIFTLRGLLADKNAKLNGSERVPPTPQKAPPDYGKMSMEALKRVDKARDATIAFILKEIDKVDDELKLLESFVDEATQDSWQDTQDSWKDAREQLSSAPEQTPSTEK